jgi:hypothetical protein
MAMLLGCRSVARGAAAATFGCVWEKRNVR